MKMEDMSMAQFNFRDYSLTLEFPGDCTFTIIGNSDMGDRIKGMHEKFTAMQADYANKKIDKQKAVKSVLNSINEVLGDGATEEIFAGREITLSDASDVMVFIANEVTKHLRKMAQESMTQSRLMAADAALGTAVDEA